jgi:hypothetical protein
MTMADEMRKLLELRDSGALTDEEFAKAKAAVLAGETSPASAPAPTTAERETPRPAGGDQSVGRAANRFVTFNIVWAVVMLAIVAAVFFWFFLPKINKANEDFEKGRQEFQERWK